MSNKDNNKKVKIESQEKVHFDPFQAVLEFNQKFKAYVGKEPHFPPQDVIELRMKLIHEETSELVSAIIHKDIEQVADAVGDLLYVVYGLSTAYGIDIRPVFDEIHKANMAKEGGGNREDGKILKPEGWKAPDIKAVLKGIDGV